jgi:two-component system nitrogen regulation sensor histidine kinase NtrY
MTGPAKPRRNPIPWWGRLELRVVASLVLLGTLCVGSSASLVELTVSYFDARWAAALEQAVHVTDDVGVFHAELVSAKISEYEARTRATGLELALGDVTPPTSTDRDRLQGILEREADLVGLAWVRPSGARSEIDRAEEYPEDRFEWYEASVDLAIPEGRGPAQGRSAGQLRAVYRIDPEIDARFQQVGARRREIVRQQRDKTEIEAAVIRVFGLASATVLVFALTLGVLVARTTTRKVGQLSRVMARVAQGDLRARAALRGRDEIAQLGAAFNGMLDDLAHAQDRLAYLQRIGAWQEMARRIAHEIKNPLTPIQLAVQQLREKDPGLSPEFSRMLRSAVEIVEDEVEGLRRMVTSFSQFAKVPEVRLARVELPRVLEEFERAYGHLTERDDDVLHVAAVEPTLVVDADRQLLKQVLVNLVENAVLSAREAKRSPVRVEVSVAVEGARIELRVDDNGPGVPEAQRERVFEPYHTTRSQGTGLGLAIVKKIILDHGGDVRVESSPLGGARFVVVLPRPVADPGASAAHA